MDEAAEQVLFQVLGPFEVVVDGRPAPLGGARQRLVLAGLVANANRVVSSDRLIDIVWGDEPPTTAFSTVQKYVHRLRASVGNRLVTRVRLATCCASTPVNPTCHASSPSSPTPLA